MNADAPRVLVIDDNADMRTLVRLVLEREGFRVEAAANGEEGLEALKRFPADVVLSDIFMPRKDGIETIEAVRSTYPKIKIIAMLAGATEAHLADYLPIAVQVGAAAFLRKPFKPQELIEILRGMTDTGLAAPDDTPPQST